MDYVDRTILALAVPATRAGVFDQMSLEQLISAAYDSQSLGLTGPFTAQFEELSLCMSPVSTATVEGSWHVAGTTLQTDAAFRAIGLPTAEPVRVDAFWRGSIFGRLALQTSEVEST